MSEYLDSNWEELEQWIRATIGSDFIWKTKPLDTAFGRKMVVDRILADIEQNTGVFPNSNAFIERKE